MDDPQALLQRRRIWGVPPDAVASSLAALQREQADLRVQIAALETRLANLSAERDAAVAAATASRETIAHLEAEKAEWKGKPETIRAEAIQFVVDAYAEAQQAREQSAREIAAERDAARTAAERERAAVTEEIAAMRREQEAERRRHAAAIAAFQQQEAEIIASLDAIGRTLLTQFGRIDVPPSAPSGSSPEIGVPASAARPLEPVAEATQDEGRPPVPAMNMPGIASESRAPETSVEDAIAVPQRGVPAEDAMLARALDELEAILRGNRGTEI